VARALTAEVDAVVGPFRFSYAKRYHCRSETRLLVRAPRVEQATGREAHERVRALLDAHLDTALWRALRIVQGAPLDAPALAGATSLVAALDRAAGVGAGGEREERPRARGVRRAFTPTVAAARPRRGGAAVAVATAKAPSAAARRSSATSTRGGAHGSRSRAADRGGRNALERTK
jgi:hypothetical protein